MFTNFYKFLLKKNNGFSWKHRKRVALGRPPSDVGLRLAPAARRGPGGRGVAEGYGAEGTSVGLYAAGAAGINGQF